MEKKNTDFLKTRLNLGLVIRADLETIERIKRFISEQPDIEIIYQIIDGGRLWIVRDNERRAKDDRLD